MNHVTVDCKKISCWNFLKSYRNNEIDLFKFATASSLSYRIKVGILFSKLHQFTICFRTHVLYYGHISKFKAIGYYLYQQPVEQVFKSSTSLINFLTQRHFAAFTLPKPTLTQWQFIFSVIYTTIYIVHVFKASQKNCRRMLMFLIVIKSIFLYYMFSASFNKTCVCCNSK